MEHLPAIDAGPVARGRSGPEVPPKVLNPRNTKKAEKLTIDLSGIGHGPKVHLVRDGGLWPASPERRMMAVSVKVFGRYDSEWATPAG